MPKGEYRMLEYYRQIEKADFDYENMAVTVIEGTAAGEKALFCNHRMVWSSPGQNCFYEYQKELGKICESGVVRIGDQKLFCEVLGREKRLVICGGGHVSVPLIQIGRMTGCRIIVLEDRPGFADRARRAGASQVICEPYEKGLAQIEGDEDTFFVIVTRGHRYDQMCLEQIVRKRHAYIGMMGSRRRAALVRENVIAGGADPAVVRHLHAPIGLDIGAESPEEIAVSIMAEIIEIKNRKRKSCGYPEEILQAVLKNGTCEKREEPGVMVTIVSRKGSAPRSIGTKMLVMPDGACVGTIGGGCVEAKVLQKALCMLRSGEKRPKLYHIDMTGSDAGEEGMACGGEIEVFLEVL